MFAAEGNRKGLGMVSIVFVGLACIVGAVLFLFLGYATYMYVQTRIIPRLSDFQCPKVRESLYTPLIIVVASRVAAQP